MSGTNAKYNVSMDLAPGEMRDFINNYHVKNGRREYEDDQRRTATSAI